MPTDVEEFGPIVARLVDAECERSLVLNSIKLRFETRYDPRGRKYIWIDPPWKLYAPHGLLTSSSDYDRHFFEEWSNLLAPLDSTVLTGWEAAADGTVTFRFARGYSIVLPPAEWVRTADDWYDHWYARDKLLEDPWVQ